MGNCAHVWHYAQSHARLFPEIGRRMRQQALSAQNDEGGIPFRQPAGGVAFDGQCGEILAACREHLTSADSKWLSEQWPRIKKAMDYTIKRWDENEDGILAGAQHNTLDGSLGGSTSWLGTLYLAALKASAKMAKLQGDDTCTERYTRILNAGSDKQNATLWNGEYYIQIPDADSRKDYNNGCHIDQLLGQWWAAQLDLGCLYPPDRMTKALASVVKYNYRPDFKGHEQKPRQFASDDQGGTLMVTWPHNDRPENPISYADEVWTGTEYALAATLIQNGLLTEGLMVMKAASDRYDGRRHEGLTDNAWGYSGNPFGDDECGKFYARAMSVWSVLLACQGLVYDGPAGLIGFKPVWKPHNHKSFFTAAEGWGLFGQKQSKKRQEETIDVRYGKLKIRNLIFQLAEGQKASGVSVSAANSAIPADFEASGTEVQITLRETVVLEPGAELKIEVTTAKA
jgi:hypothetical protein